MSPLLRRAAFPFVGLLILTIVASCAPDPDGSGSVWRRTTAGELPAEGPTYGGTLLDWDGDGWLDLLVSLHADRAEVYLNRGDLRFARLAPGSDRPAEQLDHHGSAACDFDRDGDWDVFVTTGADSGEGFAHNQLWVQSARGQYDDAVAAGLPGSLSLADPVGRGRGALWSDFDADSWPDLLLFNYRSQGRLLRSTHGNWQDVTAALPWPPTVDFHQPGRPPPGPLERSRSGWIHTAVASDFNQDGRTDLLALGRPAWSGLWLNDGSGRFYDITSTSGLKPGLWPRVPNHAAAGDLDGDGDPDLVLVHKHEDEDVDRYPVVSVWLAEPDGQRVVFRPVGGFGPLAAGHVPAFPGAWQPEAVMLADLDNDGLLDLYLVQTPRDPAAAPNRVYRGRGDGTFAEVTADWGGANSPGVHCESAWPVDLDHDGDLDLVTFNGREVAAGQPGGMACYVNRTVENHGVTLHLVASEGPPHGLGATVELVGAGRRLVRWCTAIANPVNSAILPVHIGTGTTTGPIQVEVLWSSGRVQRVRIPQTGAAYRIEEGRPLAERLAQTWSAQPGGRP